MNRIKLPVALLAVAVMAVACSDGTGPVDMTLDHTVVVSASVAPDLWTLTRNVPCTELYPDVEGIKEFKLDGDDLANGDHTVMGSLFVNIANLTDDTFDWSSNFDIYGVYVKGGNAGSNLYTYFGTDYTRGDTNLTVPDPSNNSISHISFCYLEALAISKTANATYDRTHDWDIDKSGDETELTLMPGTQAEVDYEVTVSYLDFEDHDYAVSGTVTIHNPWPTTAVITSVTDLIDGSIAVDVDCEVTFPYDLEEDGTLECTYTYGDAAGTEAENEVTVVTSAGPDGGTAKADIIWGDPENEYLACIDVYDDKFDPDNPVFLGTVCADDQEIVDDGEMVFRYKWEGSFGSELCGEFELENVAFYTDEGDDEVLDSANWIIDVTLECPAGCTLTQGYWKTHSAHGPAPMDESGAWYDVGLGLHPDGPDTPFFHSGLTWYELFWTPPQGGNAYIQLAHQYMAAALSIAAGADPSAVQEVMDDAHDFFYNNDPGTGFPTNMRNTLREWAGILDSYNNGLIGPGHCDNGVNYEE
jgi:hypothetical protein